MRLQQRQMGQWALKTALCSCQVSWRTLTVTDNGLLWVCITWTLTNGRWEDWQGRKLALARRSMCIYCTLLVYACRMLNKAQNTCGAEDVNICVFVEVCPSLSALGMQPAVCWWLSCMDDTSCWQWAWSEDASHNITAGRWEDITSKHTHIRSDTVWHSVKVISRSLFRLAIISDLSLHPH